jgi:cell division protein FtsW (lipid II flippase)
MHRPRFAILTVAWVCVFAALLLSGIGVFAMATTDSSHAKAHVVHLCVGLAAAALVALPPHRVLRSMAFPLLIVVICLLIFVLLPFVPQSIVHSRNGARRWINLVVTDFQPSELAKIAYVLSMARYLRFRTTHRRLLGLVIPFVLTLVPMGLILVEPDLGTALLFVPTLFALLIAAGAKLKHLALVALLGLSSAPLAYPVLKDHQKDRIKAVWAQMTDDRTYVNDIGFQGQQAMTLIGAGQVLGVGASQAEMLIEHNHLPEHHNDMIFAVVACRWGLVGIGLTWALFLCLLGGGLVVAGQCKDPFARLIAVGLVALLFAQMAINTGMTLGLFPITGMTLPFVSAGGTSLVTAWLMIGLLLNVGMRRPLYMAGESFQFDDED